MSRSNEDSSKKMFKIACMGMDIQTEKETGELIVITGKGIAPDRDTIDLSFSKAADSQIVKDGSLQTLDSTALITSEKIEKGFEIVSDYRKTRGVGVKGKATKGKGKDEGVEIA